MNTTSVEFATALPSTVGRQHILANLAYSSSTSVRLLRLVIVLVGIVVGFSSMRASLRALEMPAVYGKDFAQDYLFARALLHGEDPYLPLPVLAQEFFDDPISMSTPHPNPHPPVASFLAVPFALLDYQLAASAWLVFELLCLVVAVHLLTRAVDRRPSPGKSLILAASVLAWYPFFGELLNGQYMVLLLLLLASTWLALRANRRLTAGLLLGLALLVKPVAWPLVLMFVLGRSWRAFGATTATVLVGHLAAVVVIGFEGLLRYYVEILPEVMQLYRTASWNASLGTIGWRLFADRASVAIDAADLPWVPISPLIEFPVAATILSVAIPACAVAIACVIVRKHPDLDRSFAVLTCVSILVSPTVWSYYLVLAVIPATVAIDRLVQRRLASNQVNAALVVALLLVVPHQALARVVPFALAWLPLISAVAVGALWWLVVWLIGRPATASGAYAALVHADQIVSVSEV